MSAALYDHKPEAYNEKGQMEKEQSARENPEDGHLRPVIADAFALREGEEGEDFKTLGWFKAGLVITCEAIALGTLSFPKNFYALGLVGGLIANAGFVVIAFFTSCVMIDFKLRYTHVLNAADAGQVMFGRIGFWVLGIAMIAKSIGLAASHVLAGKIAISTFDGGANCSIIWAVVIAVVSAGLSYHRKWSGLTWLSVVSLSCIVTACIITMAGVATQNPERLIKNNVPIEWHAFNRDAKLVDSIGAVLNSAFSYGQVMAVLTFLPEMRRPETFKRSMLLSQIISLVLYSIVGSVCYVYAGQYVTSPALTMTTHTLRIVSYAFALVTIVVSGIVACNVGAKFWYTTALRNSALLTSKGGQLVWLAIIGAMWTVGFVLAELIPFFGDLLTIVSALTSSWFVVGLGGIMNLFLTRRTANNPDGGYFTTPSRTFFTLFSVLLILISCALTPLGLYAAIEGIKSGYAHGKFHHPFSCAA